MKATALTAASLIVSALVFASCAHQSALAPEPAEPATTESTESIGEAMPSTEAEAAEEELVGPPEVAWKDMTVEQRGQWMKAKVMPKMKPVFQAFDAEAFSEFTCASCHGKNPRERQFHMPNPDIFALPATEEAFKPVMEEKPEWVKFMAEQVTPQMAMLLGREAFNPQNPKPDAFSCMGCHTAEGGGHGEHADHEQATQGG